MCSFYRVGFAALVLTTIAALLVGFAPYLPSAIARVVKAVEAYKAKRRAKTHVLKKKRGSKWP